MGYKLPMNSDNSTRVFIRRILHHMKRTLVADNVRSAFVQIGVSHHIGVVPYRLLFDESTLRQSQGFLTLWHRSIPWNNCWPDAGQRDLDGWTERCVITGLRKDS
jgi:hypothetical protein